MTCLLDQTAAIAVVELTPAAACSLRLRAVVFTNRLYEACTCSAMHSICTYVRALSCDTHSMTITSAMVLMLFTTWFALPLEAQRQRIYTRSLLNADTMYHSNIIEVLPLKGFQCCWYYVCPVYVD
jgi:hypothetical protein